MRILSIYPSLCDERIKSGFLWFPRTCGNELRWLETAQWVERYMLGVEFTEWGPLPVFQWVSVKWLRSEGD